MLRSIKPFIYTFLIGYLLLIINSCIKQQPDCTGNCYSLVLKGKVYDITNNTGIANASVSAFWQKKDPGNYNEDGVYNIVAGTTDKDGIFNLNTTIDTTFFNNYYLYIKVPVDSSHLCIGGDSPADRFIQRFSNFNAAALQNIALGFYPKTALQISLHRTTNDSLSSLTIEYSFAGNASFGDNVSAGQSFPTDTTLLVATSANIYTKINTLTVLQSGRVISQKDSLLCTKNGTNMITINY